MSEITISPEEIEQNFVKFCGFASKLGDRAPAFTALCEGLGVALATAPASSKTQFHRACAGGLVEHSLRVLNNAIKLCKGFEWSVSPDSLIIGCLLHDIGKVGTPTDDGVVEHYVPHDSDWHVKQGNVYKHNDKEPYMSIPHRSLYICNHYGLKLTQDEMLALLLNDGFVVEENRQYCLKTGTLPFVVMTADYIATSQEKGALLKAK